MISALEKATVAAGFALRESRFGERLRQTDPASSRRASSELARLESGHGPPFHRTVFAIQSCEELDIHFDRRAEAEYLRWAMAGLTAVGSLAARCWGEIPVDLRSEVVDEDDLGALHSRYIPFSRTEEVDRAASAFEGMDRAPLADVLGEMVDEVLATDCYSACLSAVSDQRQHGGRRALNKFRNRVYDRLDEVYDQAPNLFAVGAPARAVIADIYSTAPPGVREAGITVQAHNELIQAVLWTVLGIAGQWSEPVLLTELPPAARLSLDPPFPSGPKRRMTS